MPAGDGATRLIENPNCQRCGDTLDAGIHVNVDDWVAFACREHAEAVRESAPASCIVYDFPTVTENDND